MMEDGTLMDKDSNVLDVNVSGNVPEEDSWIKVVKGQVVAYSLKFGDYVVTKLEDAEAEAVKNGTIATDESVTEITDSIKLKYSNEAKSEVASYIASLLDDSTVKGYTVDTSKKVSEITSVNTPSGIDTNSWVYFKKDATVSASDYSIKITKGEYTFVINCVDGNVSDPVESTTIEPQKVYVVPFADASWATIKANIASNRNYYAVGSEKEVVIDGTSYTVRLANTSSCPNDWPQQASRTTCGVVIEFVDTIINTGNNNTDDHVMNSLPTNEGGWPASEMRSYLNTTIFNKLPDELKADEMILSTQTVSGHESGVSTNYTSNDKLYLLSYVEVWGSNYDSDSVKLVSNIIKDGTGQLEYYAMSDSTRIKTKTSGPATAWWLRSALSTDAYSFLVVASDGSIKYGGSPAYLGATPAFRILD